LSNANDRLLVLDAVGRVEVRRHEKKSVATRPYGGKLLRASIAAPRCCSRVHRRVTEHQSRCQKKLQTVDTDGGPSCTNRMPPVVITPPATMNGHLGLVALSTFTKQPLKKTFTKSCHKKKHLQNRGTMPAFILWMDHAYPSYIRFIFTLKN
jgi:hypothetical protein